MFDDWMKGTQSIWVEGEQTQYNDNFIQIINIILK